MTDAGDVPSGGGAPRPTHGPLPEGSPLLQSAADAVLDPERHREVLAAHAERIVVSGTDRLGRAVVVKVDVVVERHRRETEVLRALRAAGVPVPEVVDAHRRDDASGASVLVLERVVGRPLDEVDAAEAWTAVGEGLARLHRALPTADAPPFAGQTDGTFADHLQAWAADDRRTGVADGWLTATQAERLDALVAPAARRAGDVAQVVLHGDCAPHHWVLGPSGTDPRPVDLGDAGVGDPTYDLMVLTLTDRHRLGSVLVGYGASRAMRAHVDAVLPGYRALRLAGEVSWLREHGFDPSPSLARLGAALA